MRLPCAIEEFLFPPPWGAGVGDRSFRFGSHPREGSRWKPLWFRLLLGLEVVVLTAILGWLALGGTVSPFGGPSSGAAARPARL